MKNREVDQTITDALALPRLVRLSENLFAASFVLMKLLPARFILDRARDAALIGRGSTIIETTSGTFGLALAMISALRGYNLILVSDPAIDDALKRRLEDLGCRVEIVREPAPVGGYQRARLNRMAELQAEFPDHFWPSQYDNPHNPGAYAPLAELLLEAIGHIDVLVGTVGSGGSMCGTGEYLRTVHPDLKLFGVDTPGSVLFGQPDRKRMLRGLGNSLMPQNLDHSVFDEVHWVAAAEAFRATRLLHQRHALFQGGTSGAAYMVGDWCARRNPDEKVVLILPDEGYRYQDTIYDDEWLHSQDLWLPDPPREPHLVDHPHEAGDRWTRLQWERRSYEQVIGGSFIPAQQSSSFLAGSPSAGD
ncbi:MAG: pyridoxal-5-phosphate-dependent protein subunit beta [Blastocatellia bacterium AA13]|nr:MAG: pyridoxal-5-phosphate-dependent protein subunit beta [Blastocatellia bacterium AA13]